MRRNSKGECFEKEPEPVKRRNRLEVVTFQGLFRTSDDDLLRGGVSKDTLVDNRYVNK